MSRRLLLAAAAILLAGCSDAPEEAGGLSQASIDAATEHHCQKQRINQRITDEGDSPELSAEMAAASDALAAVVDASGDPVALFAALNATTCP